VDKSSLLRCSVDKAQKTLFSVLSIPASAGAQDPKRSNARPADWRSEYLRQRNYLSLVTFSGGLRERKRPGGNPPPGLYAMRDAYRVKRANRVTMRNMIGPPATAVAAIPR